MKIEKRLRIDFTWVLAGNMLYSACQWLIVVALAKLGNPAQVGQYALGLAVSAPIILFANLQLRSLLASDVRGQFSFGQYLRFRLTTLALALFVVAAVASLTSNSREQAVIVIAVGVAQALEFVSETFYGLMQKHERMDRISWSLMCRGPLSLIALSLTMYFTRSLVWALLALMLGRLLVLLAWDARFDAAAAAEKSRGEWIVLLRMALPLGVISMLGSLNGNIPRYFVQAHGGSAELGIFSAVASLLSAGTLVVSAYGQAMFLPVARACANFDRSRFRNLAWLAAGSGALLGGAATLIAALFGRTLLTHLFRPEYARHADILVRLMMAGTIAFMAAGLGFVVTAARSLLPQVPLLIVTGLAAVGASAWLIPRLGLLGAADAVLIGALVQLAGTGLILMKIDRQLSTGAGTFLLAGKPVGVEAI